MTLPDERYRAVIQAKKFLLDLCNPAKTPRVPKQIRQQAHSLLRHYPSDWDMQRVSDAIPEVFAERMEPVYRMIRQYEEEKNRDDAS
jgi:hypothetical protein